MFSVNLRLNILGDFMYKVTDAVPEHIPELKNIWKQCFGDSDEYVDFFFENKVSDVRTIVLTKDTVPVGSAYFLPVRTNEYGYLKQGYYVYAVGILEEHRGNGLFKKIHEYIYEYVRKHNMFLILCPANEKLCNYYKSLGYIENAFVSEITLSRKNCKSSYETCKLTPAQLFKMRGNKFTNLICWDKNALSYILKENEFVHGDAFFIKKETEDFYFVLRKENGILKILESNIPHEKIQEFTDFLCQRYNTEKAKWIIPSKNAEPKILYGLTLNLVKDDYYFNFILN